MIAYAAARARVLYLVGEGVGDKSRKLTTRRRVTRDIVFRRVQEVI